MANLIYENVTVASGARLSGALDCNGKEVIGIIIPAAITGTTLTVQGSESTAGTFRARKTNGDAISITIAANDEIQFNPPIVASAVKFDTGATEGAARTLTVLLRQFQ